MKDAELADELHLHEPVEPPLTGPLTTFNAPSMLPASERLG